MNLSAVILPVLAFMLPVMTRPGDTITEFRHPDRPDAVLFLKLDPPLFSEFNGERRGEDYQYSGMTPKQIFLTIQFHKLAPDEQLRYPANDPRNAVEYFPLFKRFKAAAVNEQIQGDSASDVIVRKFEIHNVQGMQQDQTHIYAYIALGADVLVCIHITKSLPDPETLGMMKMIMDGFAKKR